mmetsp:Transcript_77082/g.165162  ORF Transcript_77082/g.165162 Transcript_77082/m.165162 type:complete len:127 (-) Transcript_77082:54-434(-)
MASITSKLLSVVALLLILAAPGTTATAACTAVGCEEAPTADQGQALLQRKKQMSVTLLAEDSILSERIKSASGVSQCAQWNMEECADGSCAESLGDCKPFDREDEGPDMVPDDEREGDGEADIDDA